jgi:hypothetical protein
MSDILARCLGKAGPFSALNVTTGFVSDSREGSERTSRARVSSGHVLTAGMRQTASVRTVWAVSPGSSKSSRAARNSDSGVPWRDRGSSDHGRGVEDVGVDHAGAHDVDADAVAGGLQT